MKSLFAFAMLLALCASALATGQVYLIPSAGADQYVIAYDSDANYTFSTSLDSSVAAIDALVPQELINKNRTMFGPIQVPKSVVNNPLLVQKTTPMQVNVPTTFAPESNCSASTYRLAPSSIPAKVEAYVPPFSLNCSPAPRVQIYLPASSIDLQKLEQPSHKNIDAVCDEFYCYFRTPLTPNGTVAVSRSGPERIELDFSQPHLVAAEMLRLASSGVIQNVSSSDALAAAAAFLVHRSAPQEGFSANAGSVTIAYSPPTSGGGEASWQRQPGRYVALFGLAPLFLPPAPPSAPVQNPAVTTPTPAPPNPEPAPSAPSSKPSAGSVPDAYKTPPRPLQIQSEPSFAPEPAAPPAGLLEQAQSLILSLPWWLAPLAAGALGALFVAVMAFYFRPRPVGPAPPAAEMIEISDSRMAILEDLEAAERIPTDLALRLNKSKSTIVEHLEGLCQQGLVQKVEEPGKKFVYYRLTQGGRVLLLRKRSANLMAQ